MSTIKSAMSTPKPEMGTAKPATSTTKPATSAPKPTTSTVSQLSNVLPTGTFLVFQILAPLATNNGKCGHVEVVLTGVTLSVLCLLCVLSSFSDSYTGEDGVVHYGIVTYKGLWNINFRHLKFPDLGVAPHTDSKAPTHTDPEAPTHTDLEAATHNTKELPSEHEIAKKQGFFYPGPDDVYMTELDDYVCAALSVVALATISLLTTPVTTCFYPNLSEAILKTVPVLVGLVVAAVCACGVTPRNGIGFTPPTTPATNKQSA